MGTSTPPHRRFRITAGAAICSGLTLAVLLPGVALAEQQARDARAVPSVSVTAGRDGRLVYARDARGNAVVDFSHAGYRGGGVPLPDLPARIVVPREGEDDQARIQTAIDVVSAMAPDARGHRGAVLLEPGTYEVAGSIEVRTSGVVLRGAGSGEPGTTIVATGTSRRPLLVVEGTGTRAIREASKTKVADAYVPAGARSIPVVAAAGFKAGDRIVIHRPSTEEWIGLLGMNTFPGWRPENRLHWQAGSRDVTWDRIVTGVEGNTLTVDAPITTALEAKYGGAEIAGYDFDGRLREVGVESLRLASAFDATRPHDEDHSWEALSLDKVEDAWVRDVAALHFAGFVVNVQSEAWRVTVQDVTALDPVSEIGGWRRRVFHTAGQQTLFNRCRSRGGKHDFAVGHAAAGPNVVLDSRADGAHDFSGPLGSWSSGVLFDNVIVRGNAIRFVNRGTADQGAGWTTANSVIWNSEATDIEVHSPPGALNQAYGSKGVVTGDGIVYDPRVMPYRDFYRGMPVEPRSLYRAQLRERVGEAALAVLDARRSTTAAPVDNTSRPGGDARRLAQADVDAWLASRARAATRGEAARLTVRDGAFEIGGAPAWTSAGSYSWFQAQMPRVLAERFGPAITRFAPGLRGRGLTDSLDEVVAGMKPGGVFVQHYGLWYDRRRVDHNYYGSNEQRTGDVWAPFMELPWARSGTGKAWDGLSLYDLTRFNPWYFERVKTFADLADREGRVLYYAFYFQHWLLESRSHYADFPWRPVNAIQDTGLPDEVPAANAFYDLSHPVRRDLHQRYIRKVLDTLGPHANVVFGIDREYTGSLEFVRFWLDEIAAWQRAHGKRVVVALEIPKDQMDAVLADPERAPLVTAIGFHGWLYRADGRLFAIKGGLDRAPRQQRPDIATQAELDALRQAIDDPARLAQADFLNGPEFQRLFDTLWKGSPFMHYRARREYRDSYPELVLLEPGDEFPDVTRAVEALVPRDVRSSTRPADIVRHPRETSWAMADPGRAYVVYAMAGGTVDLDLTNDVASYELQFVDAAAPVLVPAAAIPGGRVVTLTPPPALSTRPWVAWLRRIP